MHGRGGAAAAAAAQRSGVRGTSWLAWAVLAVPALLSASFARAQDVVYSAEHVKAAFLYHFATYVQWPSAATADDVFTIAVLNADVVADELEEFLPGHTLQGRPMEVDRLHSIDELKDHEMLYIGPGENRRIAAHLEAVASRPVLVVTDVPQGLRRGAVINFRIVDERVRFEISLRAARRAGLELSSRLLAAAMLVEAAGAIIRIDNSVADRWPVISASWTIITYTLAGLQ